MKVPDLKPTYLAMVIIMCIIFIIIFSSLFIQTAHNAWQEKRITQRHQCDICGVSMYSKHDQNQLWDTWTCNFCFAEAEKYGDGNVNWMYEFIKHRKVTP